MDIDPATICARTAAGESELAQARNGLTLPQRKTLSLLAAPRAYAEFAAENNLDPVRLARDFSRLAELGLITLQLGAVVLVPSAPPRDAAAVRSAPAARPRGKPAAPSVDDELRPVVLGAAPVRAPLRVALFAGIVAVAVGAGWLLLRDDPRATLPPEAVASQATHATTASSNLPIVAASTAAPDVAATARAPAAAATTTPMPPLVRTTRTAPERAVPTREAALSGTAQARATDAKLAAAPPIQARAPTVPPPIVERAPADAAPTRERVAEPAVASPVVAPPAASAPPPAPPPVQIASAARPAVAPLPPVKSALQPIVRETPEFPKEAITEGITSGTVKARITLDGSGRVTGIEILDAQPRRVFDRAVRAALWRWQYAPGAPNRTADVEVAFTRQ